MQFSSKDIQLFNESRIHVEDKNYTNSEVERLKIKVTDFIVSQSTKDIDKYSKKFSSLLWGEDMDKEEIINRTKKSINKNSHLTLS